MAIAEDALVVIHGAACSVYTRIARLALLEKGVSYRLDPVDVFAAGGPPASFVRDHHPFGQIPAFTHCRVRLYEAAAIVRYADAACDAPPLTPDGGAGSGPHPCRAGCGRQTLGVLMRPGPVPRARAAAAPPPPPRRTVRPAPHWPHRRSDPRRPGARPCPAPPSCPAHDRRRRPARR